MAIVNFVSGKIISLKDDGSVNAGGRVEFYIPATSTPKDTYPTNADAIALTNANANPLILDSAGRGTAFLNGDYKVIVKTSALVTIYTTDSVNYTATVTSTARSSAYTLIVTDSSGVTEASGTFTLTLTAAATLGSGWYHYVKNVGSGTVTIARANAGNTINGTAANLTLVAGQDAVIRVIAAATGFITDTGPAISNTWSASQTFTPSQYFDAGIGPSYVQNYSLAGSVAANALTITMSGYNGTALSSTNKHQLTFINSNTQSTSEVISVTANKTLVISSGSTLAATSGVPFRVWILGVRDGSAGMQLGAIVCSTATNIYPLMENRIITSVAEGGAGAADSAGVIYTTSALTESYRVLGYMDFTLATAGTWLAPDFIRLFQVGLKLPGDVVQTTRNTITTLVTGSTVIPVDNTIPQNTEGFSILDATPITPTAAANRIRIRANTFGADTVVGQVTIALFRDAVANALAATGIGHSAGANYVVAGSIEFMEIAPSTSAVTYKLRGGPEGANTTYFNSGTATVLYGGVAMTQIIVEELMG